MKHTFLLCLIAFLLLGCENKKTCPVCNGRGSTQTIVGEMTCSACFGEKEVSAERYETIKNAQNVVRPSQAANPYERSVQQESQVKCPMCSGTGVFSYYGSSQTCSECKGSGHTTATRAAQLRQALQQIDQMTGGGGYGNTSIDNGNYYNNDNGGSPETDRSCHSCHGTGDCQHCKGSGVVEYDGQYATEGGVMNCPICKGTKRCGVCHGSGHI